MKYIEYLNLLVTFEYIYNVSFWMLKEKKNPSKLQGIREKVGLISKYMNVFIAIIFLSTILISFETNLQVYGKLIEICVLIRSRVTEGASTKKKPSLSNCLLRGVYINIQCLHLHLVATLTDRIPMGRSTTINKSKMIKTVS